jgi:hypothetical protein
MCVIIDKDPGVLIPLEQLKTACDIDKDGFGIAFVEKGRIKIIRKTTKNDPNHIFRVVKKHKDKRLFIHLRHATVGDISEVNSHPFLTLEKSTDGFDVAMMHNGTLFCFQPNDKEDKHSDTFYFNRDFLRPWAKRLVPFAGTNLLKDAGFQWVIKKEVAYSASIFLIFDNHGNVLRVNEEKGKHYTGYWASNDHLTTTWHHRLPKTTTTVPWHGSRGNSPGTSSLKTSTSFPWALETEDGSEDYDWDKYVQQMGGEETDTDTSTRDALTPKSAMGSKSNSDRSPLRFIYEIKEVSIALKTAWRPMEKSIVNILNKLDEKRTTFCALTGIKSLAEVTNLTETQLTDLCDQYPMAMSQLFIDMFAENTKMRKELLKSGSTLMGEV